MTDFPSVPSTLRESKLSLEERMIDAEYKIWKKNSAYLYDFVMTHSLEWPSLTCQWLPTVKQHQKASGGTIVEHSMLLGTHTSQGDQNYIMVASINLPNNQSDEDRPVTDDMEDRSDEKESTKALTPKKTPAANYDEERSELGGYGSGDSSIGKIHIRMKIKHEGEVHRARYMPQNYFVVATRGPQAPLYIWDFSKHPSFPEAGGQKSQAQGICIGHEGEGYGLCWSPHKTGWLVSSSEDKTVRLWDINAAIDHSSSSNNSGTMIHPLSTFTGHSDVVEDVDWHHRDQNLVGSVGDDKSIRLWDIRKTNATESVQTKLNAHDHDVNSIAFNPINEFLFATGSSDTTVALWDLRNLQSRVQTFKGHTDQVFNLGWAPFNESILASCSSDRRVAIWDLSRIGMEQTPEDAEDGPPELLFLHGGHCSKVSDFSWNVNDIWTMVSVADDNVLQVWNMAEDIYAADEDDDMEAMENGEDGALDDDDL